ncbi:hypothetical protein BSR19_00805 [Streptococcus salivarius]|uniref:Integrase n=1 Tax=Streptococcus salivarius TaxID=1304 RepID=A0AB37DCR1_STRSL|nr:hypothetical protein BSR19_00805 [Streptococcus salivarius]
MSKQSFRFVFRLNQRNLYLTKQIDYSLEAISKVLNHSNKEITKTYVNTKDTVNQTVGDIAFHSLK